MKQKYALDAKKRTLIGKKVKQLRRARKLPANVFGHGVESVAIELDEKAFSTIFAKAGETSIVGLTIDGEAKERPVLITHIAYDPLDEKMLHVDLQQVSLTEKVTANVSVEVVGESEAVKAGGVLLVMHDEIEVEALPMDLPEKFVLDISALKAIGASFKVSDLAYDTSKVTLSLDGEEVLVTIQEPKKEEEVVVVAPIETETTVQGKKEEVEGEAGAEAGKGKEEKPAAKPAAEAKKEEKK